MSEDYKKGYNDGIQELIDFIVAGNIKEKEIVYYEDALIDAAEKFKFERQDGE